MAGQVFAVASGKGGVGKTTTAVNLGVVLRRADHSVALVDADLGMANLGPMLGVDAELTLHDVLSGTATLEDALVEEAPGFAVLAGSEALADYPTADPRHLRAVLETLAAEYDFVIVDTGAGMSHEDVLPLGLADRVVLVASPDPAAIGDTRKTAELAGLAEGDIAGLVVTKADAETDVREVAAGVGVDLLGVIPYDPTVRQSTAAGRPLEAVDPDTPAAVAYRDLADTLSDGAADPLREAPAAEEMHADAAPAPDAEPGSEEPTADATADDSDAAAAASEPTPDEPAEPESPTEAAPAEEAAEPATDATPEAEPAASETPEDEAPSDPEGAGDGQEAGAPEGPEPEADEAAADPEGDADGEPVEPADEAPEDAETEESETAANEAEAPEPEEAETEDEEEEDPLAEFMDDEPESSGGLLSRIGRLFR